MGLIFDSLLNSCAVAPGVFKNIYIADWCIIEVKDYVLTTCLKKLYADNVKYC